MEGGLFGGGLHCRPVHELPVHLQHHDLPRDHHRSQKRLHRLPRNAKSPRQPLPRHPRRAGSGDDEGGGGGVGELLEAMVEPSVKAPHGSIYWGRRSIRGFASWAA